MVRGSDELYHPQHLFTMSPIDTTKYYLKVRIEITNTSTIKQVLAPHTIENAAQITDWLKQIQQQDMYLKDELKTVFSREVIQSLFKYKTFAL